MMKRIGISLIVMTVFCGSAFGATLNLTAKWTANTEPDMMEYRLYRTDVSRTLIGTTPHPDTSFGPFPVTVPDGSSGTLIFVVTAVDTSNLESADSNPSSYTYDLKTATVTIAATDNTATEAGPTTGTLTFSRTGSTVSALIVYYAVGGTATSGSDYNSLSGSVSIPSGSSSAAITVTPIDDSAVESDETVIATITANAAYTVGSPSSATVTITSDDRALPYTVTTDPSDLQIEVDGSTYTAPYSFNWMPASKHKLSVRSPQNGDPGVKYMFGSWSDGGSKTHTITAPASSKTYAAKFTTKNSLTTSVNLPEGGTVSPSGTSWYKIGTNVSVTATPHFGYRFIGWSGDYSGSKKSGSKKSIAVDMDGPKNVMASFEAIPEDISVPTKPKGKVKGYTGVSYFFSTSSSSNIDHSLEYQYDWDDGSPSVWSSNKQSHIWKIDGTYQIKVKARCATHTSLESTWSNITIVTINQKPFVHVTAPMKGESWVVGTAHTITWDSGYLTAGTLYLFCWYGGNWHPIDSFQTPGSSPNSYNWTVPDTLAALASSPKPKGDIQSIKIWIGNWVIGSDGKGRWECWDSNDQSFRILDDEWLFKISKGDTGGATLLFDESSFDGYGVSYEWGTFRIRGNYDIDTNGFITGTYGLSGIGTEPPASGSGNIAGSVNSNATKMTLAVKDLNELPVSNMAGVRLLNEPDILGNWVATISGDAIGSFDPLTIDSFQDGGEAVSHVFRISGSGSGSFNIQGNLFFTPGTKTDSYGNVIGNIVYGIYQMTGGINETGVISGTINPTKGKFILYMTSDNGNNKYKLVGKK